MKRLLQHIDTWWSEYVPDYWAEVLIPSAIISLSFGAAVGTLVYLLLT